MCVAKIAKGVASNAAIAILTRKAGLDPLGQPPLGRKDKYGRPLPGGVIDL